MRKIACLLVMLVLLIPVALVAACDDDSEADVKWSMITYTQEGSNITDTMYKFAQLVEEKTDGKMEITVFPGDTLFTATEALDAVSSGNCEGGFVPLPYIVGKMPYTAFGVMSCLMAGNDIWDTVDFQEKAVELSECQAELDDNNIKAMLIGNSGYVEMFYADAVETLADMSGKKIRSFGGYADSWIQMMGSTPVTMPAAEVYISAETGLIDGSWGAIYDYYNMKTYEVMPYFVVSRILPGANPWFFHAPSFDELDADIQAAVLDAVSEAQEWGIQQEIISAQALIAEFESDPDIHVVYLSEADYATLYNTIVMPVIQGMVTSQLGEDFWNKLVDISENL